MMAVKKLVVSAMDPLVRKEQSLSVISMQQALIKMAVEYFGRLRRYVIDKSMELMSQMLLPKLHPQFLPSLYTLMINIVNGGTAKDALRYPKVMFFLSEEHYNVILRVLDFGQH